MLNLTPKQMAWLRANGSYEPVQGPRPLSCFQKTGILYADGSFIAADPARHDRIEAGCLRVGVADFVDWKNVAASGNAA